MIGGCSCLLVCVLFSTILLPCSEVCIALPTMTLKFNSCSDPKTALLSEVEIDDKLTACRAQCAHYIENSFPTIAGVNANAATIHYRYASCCLFEY